MRQLTPSSGGPGNLDAVEDGTELKVDVLPVVLNALQNPVFVKDERFRLVFPNDAFCKLTSELRRPVPFP